MKYEGKDLAFIGASIHFKLGIIVNTIFYSQRAMEKNVKLGYFYSLHLCFTQTFVSNFNMTQLPDFRLT